MNTNSETHVSPSKLTCFKNISDYFKQDFNKVVPLCFLLNFILFLPVLFPTLNDIYCWDTSLYINNGRLLVDKGIFPMFASNPLVGFLFAVTYIPIQDTTFWLVHSYTFGLIILFTLMWISACLVSKQLSYLAPPIIVVGIFLLSPALRFLLMNPTDALFAAMSAFALWQVLLFYHQNKIKHLWLASFFMALAALSRNDGLVCFVILVFLAIILNLRKKRSGLSPSSLTHSLVAVILPFAIIVGGYMIFYGLNTGKFRPGIMERTYLAFEQGQGFIYGASPQNGMIVARRLFGDPQKNQYSVLNAIKRNPEAFLDRVRHILQKFPFRTICSMYGGHQLGLIFILLAALGIIDIARKKLYLLLLILLFWPAYLFVYFITFFRGGYFLLSYYIIFFLIAVGLRSVIFNLNKKILCFWSVVLFGLAVWGMLDDSSYLFLEALFFMVALWILQFTMNHYRGIKLIKPLGLLMVFCFALFMQKDRIEQRFRNLGTAPNEQAVLFMRDHLRPGSLVMAYWPREVFCAKMTFEPLNYTQYQDMDEHALTNAFDVLKINGFFINKAFRTEYPKVWTNLQKMIGKRLEVAFTSVVRLK